MDNNSDLSGNDNENENTHELQNDVKRKKRTNSAQQPSRKLKKNELYKPPTVEELNRLKQAENLDNCNLFQLQIEELLAEVKVSKQLRDKITFWIQNFEQFLENLIECDDVQLDEIVKIRGRKISLTPQQKLINELFTACINLTCDQNVTLKFGKPDCFKILGAYGLDSSINLDMHVNISLKIPASCFHKKDYLNNRYLVKCYYYLVYIYANLKDTVLFSNLSIKFYNGIKYLPFLQIESEICEGVVFNIYASGPEKHFKLNRLEPNKNNIKFDTDIEFHDIDVTLFSKSGTPLYNSIIAKDMTLHFNYGYMENMLNVSNIQDASKLIQVWLRQRNLNKGFGNFSTDMVFYVLAYLNSRQKINQYMSSYQIVRVFWSFLCNTNWSETPISLCEDVKEDKLNSYKSSYEVVFLDKCGSYNVASFLNLEVYFKLRREARLAIKMLNTNRTNAFSSLFIVNLPFLLQYDAVAKINNDDNFKSVYKTISDSRKWHFYGFYTLLVLKEVINIVKQGFGNRVHAVVPYISEMNAEVTNIKFFTSHFMFGVILNPEYAFSPIIVAPSDDEAKIEKFRRFWKGRSDLLRLNDGTFAEAVQFNCGSLNDRKHVFEQIIKFLLSDNLNLCVYVISDQFEEVLKNPNGKCLIEENCNTIKAVYNNLNKMLRSLDLPLGITSMQGTSDVFSCAELIPPVAVTPEADKNTTRTTCCLTMKQESQYNTTPKYVYPIVCVIQLGMNSQWSNDIELLRSLKVIFYFQISALLKKHFRVQSKINEQYLDIFYDGLIFRIKLYIPKEIQLLKKIVNSKGIVSYKDNPESISLETELEILPKITGALTGLNSRISSFGLCCVLIKRWLRSQLLDGSYISDNVINLLTASLYLNSAPYEESMLPQIGFLRFLKFISDPNWNLNPIVVNFNDELKAATLNELIVKFQQRKDNPNLYIITPYDNGKSVFTTNSPALHILKRMSALAIEACKFVDLTFMDWKYTNIKNLFVPSLDGYNLLINLNDNLNPLAHMQVMLTDPLKQKPLKIIDGADSVVPVIDFNPVEIYLKELRETFANLALFFHDTYGGNIISVLWTKQAMEAVEYKLENVYYRKLYNNKLILNTDLIITDLTILGGGIVQSVIKL